MEANKCGGFKLFLVLKYLKQKKPKRQKQKRHTKEKPEVHKPSIQTYPILRSTVSASEFFSFLREMNIYGYDLTVPLSL